MSGWCEVWLASGTRIMSLSLSLFFLFFFLFFFVDGIAFYFLVLHNNLVICMNMERRYPMLSTRLERDGVLLLLAPLIRSIQIV